MKCNIPQNQKHTKKMSREDEAKLQSAVRSAMAKVILNADYDDVEKKGDTNERNER